jgi:ankyrin repeat protein
LYFAAREGHLEVTKLLLEYKADPSVSDNDGCEPLHMALKGKHKEIVQVLKKARPDISHGMSYINTAYTIKG